MDQRWVTVKRVLTRALELPVAERADFLTAQCGNDHALRREVESLLRAPEDQVAFLEDPAISIVGTADLGRRIGRYQLTRELGSGGMGTVYRATRMDAEFEHTVAIKLLNYGTSPAEVERRFRLERQILANLNHPNIAQLFEGGTTDDGRPYLVMELIDGLPIDEYCASERLGVRARLKLFRKVCAAVQFAHKNLVVHRDLKPSNIMVDENGETKLLDFGIAKILDAAESPADRTKTAYQPRTPNYASPEQLLGQPITTATDVYALGVLLYELLTGQLPYPIADASDDERRRFICTVVPENPSAVVGRTAPGASTDRAVWHRILGRKRLRQLTGDLDNIVQRALRKEPERRYDSVERFSDDIRRHLVGLPIKAG